MAIFLIILFVLCVGVGYVIGKIFGSLFSNSNEKYVDKSTHIHLHNHEHKHINIIDEETKKSVFRLRKNEENKRKF